MVLVLNVIHDSWIGNRRISNQCEIHKKLMSPDLFQIDRDIPLQLLFFSCHGILVWPLSFACRQNSWVFLQLFVANKQAFVLIFR